jgi:hypothetical protein
VIDGRQLEEPLIPTSDSGTRGSASGTWNPPATSSIFEM